MTRRRKGHDAGDRATPKASDNHNRAATASRIKALIVGAACWGLLPVKLAEWIIGRLHLEAA
jgi:hypothetical protein